MYQELLSMLMCPLISVYGGTLVLQLFQKMGLDNWIYLYWIHYIRFVNSFSMHVIEVPRNKTLTHVWVPIAIIELGGYPWDTRTRCRQQKPRHLNKKKSYQKCLSTCFVALFNYVLMRMLSYTQKVVLVHLIGHGCSGFLFFHMARLRETHSTP